MERLDLATYSKEIKQDYDKVVSGELTYVIYTTLKDSSLKPTVHGDGDINEFITEFEEGAVQFGYIRVNPYGSDVQKLLLVGWCPDSAPLKSKVSFSNNVAEVGRILHYHVQVTARDPDDLDVDDLLKTVGNASGARYSIQTLQGTKSTSKAAPKPVSKPAPKPAPVPKPIQQKPVAPKPVKADPEDEWDGEEEIQERDFSKKPLETLPSAYKPTKVDIDALRKGPSQTTNSEPATVSLSLGDGRLSSLPKPKVNNSVASKFQEVVQPSFGSKPAFGAPPKEEHPSGGLSRNFGSTNGKTPAQIWAEKKGQYKDLGHDSKPVNAETPDESEVDVGDVKSKFEALKVADEPKAEPKSTSFPPPPVRSSFPPPPVRSVPKQEEPEEEEEEEEEEEQEPEPSPAPPALPTAARPTPAPPAASSAPTAVAEYDYEASEDNEIGFAEGETIVEIKFVDEDWWLGTNAAGKSGLFPSTYVTLNEDSKKESAPEPAAEPDPEPEPEAAPGLTAVAEYDYEATEDNEITFSEQDLITDIEQVDDDWWLGSVNGQRGLFPANYVKLQD
ncbi:hypothetical protein OGAPHI_006051 [Ogataea philodendri]|uniref:Actin binding protein n=1 Tax=Ogataea philodendri TaxID=1378263 RepID=A0A9P8NZ43_9ASCO|nr:uncharacterized protein OGAPHI_006051 [Ogataea philodendri]KAH3661872.1 hypothetical protein OGAPHI_006051 [Ogataea philodendri]